MLDSRATESWTWYVVVTLVVICRYISRYIRLGGWRYLEWDDGVMVLAFGFYTNLIVWVNIQEKHPRTNVLPATGTAGMDDAEIKDRIYGSKATFVIEECMVVLQFLCKLCMCMLYLKLTSGLKRQIYVKILVAYIVGGFVITEVFFFGIWCRPFKNYFLVFDGNSPQCETVPHHLIMSYVFNMSSDVLMLIVPLPLLLKSKLPWKQKSIVTGIFSFGIFVIISATLSRYYCFAHPESILWIHWYVREASTAVIVANIPHLYALLRKLFNLESFGQLVRRTTKRTRYFKYGPPNSVELKRPHKHNDAAKGHLSGSRTESTERFASLPHGEQVTGGSGSAGGLRIWQLNEVSVDASEARWEDEGDAGSPAIWSGGPAGMGTKATVVSNSTWRSKESV